ncbi:V-type ATP synthase subunit D [Murdochiella massiliensis]|uniref:V-type ATP synthase subunit D n=1 Tax=Murdochiella massiliensis TaxID=1673723 RepID=UPI0008329AC3|nr:V-type ATP synthase subunit D [Murdochiella massiliensis]
MTRLNVNPTRMVMTGLKERLKTAERGHKLLKDKQDELMRRFIALAKENRTLREEVEKELQEAFRAFSMASAVMSDPMLENALLSSKQRMGVDVRVENIMSVRIPAFSFTRTGVEEGKEANIYPYGFAQTSVELDVALKKLNDVTDRLLELAKLEKSCQLMAKEIESTRRRVNALEYRTIPDLEETITYIRMKLEEEDRATITRLLKIKDLISQAREEGRQDIEVLLQTNQ